MRKIKQLLLVSFALTIVLSSCSVDKRIHMSGYNIQWKNNNNRIGNQEVVKNNATEIKSETGKVEPALEVESSETSFLNNQDVIEDNVTASADIQLLFLQFLK